MAEEKEVKPPQIKVPDAFRRSLTDWSEQFLAYEGRNQILQQQITSLGNEVNRLMPLAAKHEERVGQAMSMGTEIAVLGRWFLTPEMKFAKQQVSELEKQLVAANNQFKENLFFLDLYSIVPALLSSGNINSVDESLAAISTADISPDTIAFAKKQISALLSSRDRGTLLSGLPGIDEELTEEPDIEMPPLQPPTETKVVPLSIHRVSVQNLVKALITPKVPTTSMSEEEYRQFLREKNYSEEDIDAELGMTVEKLVALAQNRKSMIDAYKSEGVTLPSLTLSKILQMTIVTPPLAALEALGFYYEHTSMPAAGWLYGKIPDIHRAYLDFKAKNPDATDREARVYAWEQWNVPWTPTAIDFIIKNMVMETFTDPATLLGFRFITKGLRALGPAGRALAMGNIVIGEVLEAPFDFAKWIANSVLPKTIRQQATVFSRNSEQVIKGAFEKYYNSSITLYRMTTRQLKEAGEFALKHLSENPTADDDMALAARELLVHAYVSKKEAAGWMGRLRRLGDSPMEEGQITEQTLRNLSSIFENVFSKKTVAVEEASFLLKALGIMEGSEEAFNLAERILAERADRIFAHALSFTEAKTTRAALSALSGKQSKIYEAIVSSDVQKEAVKAGRFALFTYNIERKYIASWAHYINRYVIRSAADTYLTFGGYGFGNAGEDMWRSFLGGVKPGRASIDDIDTAFIGLVGDPVLRARGLSEMIGQLREVDEQAWHNWILTFSTLWAGIPTYLISRGGITPRRVGEKAFQFMVETPGAFSADVKRNFVVGKYGQILAEIGGDTYKALANLVPPKLPSELTSAPKWLKRKLLADLRNHVTTGKLTSDNPEMIKALKGRFTIDKIMDAEINDILMRYPELSPSSRSLTSVARKSGELMRSPESIDAHMKLLSENEVDDFLRSPERAADNFDDLTAYLTEMAVQSPRDMSELIVGLQRMATTYAMLPDQIIARATIKSRGLPTGKREVAFNTELDSIQSFLDRAGVDIDEVTKKLTQISFTPEKVGSVDWVNVAWGKQFSPEMQTTLKSVIESLPFEFKTKLKRVTTNSKLLGFAAWKSGTGELIFKNAFVAQSPGVITHELGHSVYSEALASNPALVQEFWRIAKLDKKIIAAKNETLRRQMLMDADEAFAESFRDYSTDPNLLRGTLPEHYRFFEDFFPSEQKDLRLPDAYKGAVSHFNDLITQARQVVTRAKLQDIEFRRDFFAETTARDKRDNTFWERFYAEVMSHWRGVNKEVAPINSQLQQAIIDINTASGLKTPVRPAVKVAGRPLAPADIAKLMGTRGDDISRMLLDTLIPEGDKDYFVEYVSGLVRRDYDVGFDKASIGAVYDQIAASIQVDPNSASWFRIRQKQIESMGQDLHDLYNAKLFPKEQKEAIDRLIDDTATKTDTVFDAKMAKPGGIVSGEEWDKTRQQALDESLKWLYKEYTDYSNPNALDSIMTQFYPFWRYESQRWAWLPRSFIRHPGTLTAWGRWEDNTDYGYVHIPGTSIDVNPARGTVYGPWSTRLLRRDYPEYYDELEGMGGIVGFFDFISRYGFYPNVIFGFLQAQFGGATGQLGGILPSIASTPLNAMIAAFPDNKIVNFISERVFPENFRQYLTARGVDDLGGDGSLVNAKRKGGLELTPEEEAMWAQAHRSTALHSALFEQLGFARMRSDESYALAQAATEFIEEQYGYTAEQQRQLRQRGEKLWDAIGGLDPWETAMLQELDFFKYSGSVNPVLPSHKQEILNRNELDWADVMRYSESQVAEISLLQQDFLAGSDRGRLSPGDFLYRVRDLYRKRRDYIDEKTKANPLMLLENRVDFLAKYKDPMPVQSPYNELMDLFFSIELKDTVDPGSGERILDWDKFWANRGMIDDAIPESDRGKWDAFLSRHTVPIMQVWQDVYNTYFKKYYALWDKMLSTYSDDEQRLINEYLFLEKTGQQLDRQASIKETIFAKDGRQLISSFRSSVSDEREALRYANPQLDAWLFYWGKTKSFKTANAESVYKQLAKRTGRQIE